MVFQPNSLPAPPSPRQRPPHHLRIRPRRQLHRALIHNLQSSPSTQRRRPVRPPLPLHQCRLPHPPGPLTEHRNLPQTTLHPRHDPPKPHMSPTLSRDVHASLLPQRLLLPLQQRPIQLRRPGEPSPAAAVSLHHLDRSSAQSSWTRSAGEAGESGAC